MQHDGRGPLGPAKSLKAVAGEAYKSRWLLLPVALAGVLFYSRFAIAAWALGQCRVMLHVPWPWMLLTEDQQKDVNFWGGELFGICLAVGLMWMLLNYKKWQTALLDYLLQYPAQRLVFRHFFMQAVEDAVFLFTIRQVVVLMSWLFVPSAIPPPDFSDSSLLEVVRFHIDARMGSLIYVVTSLLWYGVHVNLFQRPLDKLGFHSVTVLLRCAVYFSVALLRVYPIMNRAGVSLSVATVSLIQHYPLLMLMLGAASVEVSDFCGSWIRASAGVRLFSIGAINLVNVAAVLWSTAAGRAVGEQLMETHPDWIAAETSPYVELLFRFAVLALCGFVLLYYAMAIWLLYYSSPLVSCYFAPPEIVSVQFFEGAEIVNKVYALYTKHLSPVLPALPTVGKSVSSVASTMARSVTAASSALASRIMSSTLGGRSPPAIANGAAAPQEPAVAAGAAAGAASGGAAGLPAAIPSERPGGGLGTHSGSLDRFERDVMGLGASDLGTTGASGGVASSAGSVPQPAGGAAAGCTGASASAGGAPPSPPGAGAAAAGGVGGASSWFDGDTLLSLISDVLEVILTADSLGMGHTFKMKVSTRILAHNPTGRVSHFQPCAIDVVMGAARSGGDNAGGGAGGPQFSMGSSGGGIPSIWDLLTCKSTFRELPPQQLFRVFTIHVNSISIPPSRNPDVVGESGSVDYDVEVRPDVFVHVYTENLMALFYASPLSNSVMAAAASASSAGAGASASGRAGAAAGFVAQLKAAVTGGGSGSFFGINTLMATLYMQSPFWDSWTFALPMLTFVEGSWKGVGLLDPTRYKSKLDIRQHTRTSDKLNKLITKLSVHRAAAMAAELSRLPPEVQEDFRRLLLVLARINSRGNASAAATAALQSHHAGNVNLDDILKPKAPGPGASPAPAGGVRQRRRHALRHGRDDAGAASRGGGGTDGSDDDDAGGEELDGTSTQLSFLPANRETRRAQQQRAAATGGRRPAGTGGAPCAYDAATDTGELPASLRPQMEVPSMRRFGQGATGGAATGTHAPVDRAALMETSGVAAASIAAGAYAAGDGRVPLAMDINGVPNVRTMPLAKRQEMANAQANAAASSGAGASGGPSVQFGVHEHPNAPPAVGGTAVAAGGGLLGLGSAASWLRSWIPTPGSGGVLRENASQAVKVELMDIMRAVKVIIDMYQKVKALGNDSSESVRMLSPVLYEAMITVLHIGYDYAFAHWMQSRSPIHLLFFTGGIAIVQGVVFPGHFAAVVESAEAEHRAQEAAFSVPQIMGLAAGGPGHSPVALAGQVGIAAAMPQVGSYAGRLPAAQGRLVDRPGPGDGASGNLAAGSGGSFGVGGAHGPAGGAAAGMYPAVPGYAAPPYGVPAPPAGLPYAAYPQVPAMGPYSPYPYVHAGVAPGDPAAAASAAAAAAAAAASAAAAAAASGAGGLYPYLGAPYQPAAGPGAGLAAGGDGVLQPAAYAVPQQPPAPAVAQVVAPPVPVQPEVVSNDADEEPEPPAAEAAPRLGRDDGGAYGAVPAARGLVAAAAGAPAAAGRSQRFNPEDEDDDDGDAHHGAAPVRFSAPAAGGVAVAALPAVSVAAAARASVRAAPLHAHALGGDADAAAGGLGTPTSGEDGGVAWGALAQGLGDM